MKQDFLLKDINLLENVFIDTFKLMEDGFEDLKENSEDNSLILSYINGFKKEGEEGYIKSYSEVEAKMKKYGLDIKKVYFDGSIDPKFLFYLEPFIYIYKGFLIKITITLDSDKLFGFIKNVCNELDEYFINKNPLKTNIFYNCPQRYEVTLFNVFGYALEKKDRVEFGESLYLSSDFGANNISEELIDEIFNNNKSIDLKEKLKDLINEDGTLTIYRGVGGKSKRLEEAYAWTTDLNVAKFFATRLEENIFNINVFKLNIKLSEIKNFVGGNESEVIVSPDIISNYDLIGEVETIEFDKSIKYKLK